MTQVEGLVPQTIIEQLDNNQGLRNSLKLGDDRAKRLEKLAVLVSDVAVTKLGGKKARKSYELRFRVRLRKVPEGTSEFRWVTIITKKQDLKSSLRCVKAFQGLARHLSSDTYKHRFVGQDVNMQMFEIGQWMQSGGTKKYALRIKRTGADGIDKPTWVTWRINPESFYGGLPLLPHDDADPQESRLKPKNMFVCLNENAAVHDLESQLPPGAGFWDEARESIRWKNVTRGVMRTMAGLPMAGAALGSKLPLADTHQKRIEKQEKIIQFILDTKKSGVETDGLYDSVQNAFDSYQQSERRSLLELTDDQVFRLFGLHPSSSTTSRQDSDDTASDSEPEIPLINRARERRRARRASSPTITPVSPTITPVDFSSQLPDLDVPDDRVFGNRSNITNEDL